MSIDDFERTNRILGEALLVADDQREEFVARACAGDRELEERVRSLLVASDQPGFEEGGARAGETWDQLSKKLLGLSEGSVLGRYRIVREVGSGGMAVVFLAERTDGVFDQDVALKVLKPNPNAQLQLERFEQERQILARLHHPNIARIFDGGLSKHGQAFLVMEWVDGLPIDEYCEHHALLLDDRIQLVLQVCDAVAAAHRQLVVHRDLKPSNILVTADGHAKLLDFGIAKVLEQTQINPLTTGPHGRMLTPQYATPEQVRGEPVSTATDVYQLGCLLYLLLTGRPSCAISATTDPLEIERIVCQQTPDPPSAALSAARVEQEAAAQDSERKAGTKRWKLEGDLDAIIMTALRKEPDRRYESVAALADDLRRYCHGHPVKARADSRLYRVRRFVRRHRLLTGLAGFLIVYAATLSASMLLVRTERDRAKDSAARARAMTEFLVGLFSDADPNNSGRGDMTVRELVARAPPRIESEMAGQPAVHAELLAVTGRIFDVLGDEQQAESLSQRALKLGEGLGKQGTRARMEAGLRLANLRIAQRREQDAFLLLDQVDAELQRNADSLENEPAERARVLISRARGKRSQGAFDEALQFAVEAERVLRDLKPPESRLLLHVRASIANTRRMLKSDPDQAIALLEQSLAEHQTFYGDSHPLLLDPMKNLAAAYGARGYERLQDQPPLAQNDFDRVTELIEAAAVITRSNFGEQHPAVADLHSLLGSVAQARSDTQRMRLEFQRALTIYAASPGHDDEAAMAKASVGLAELLSGDAAAAVRSIASAIESFQTSTTISHQRLSTAHYHLAEAHHQLGDRESELQHFQAAYQTFSDTAGAEHPRSRVLRQALIQCYLELAEEALKAAAPERASRHLVQIDLLSALDDAATDQEIEERLARVRASLG